MRRSAPWPDFVDEAPLDLVFVADYSRMKLVPVAFRESYASVAAGAISQNVYLFAGGNGLDRIDHNITDNYRLTFRYIHDSWQTQTENPLWGFGSSFENINTKFVGPGSSFVARLNANITPTLLNEFVASYTADHIFLTAVNNPALPSDFTCTSPGQPGCMGC